jgi:hypothetical protein
MGRKDVFEHIVDGTSGIVPGDVSGKALVVGVCSKGEVGKTYYLGKRSDLTKLLGTGPLVDRLNDLFTAAGQEATVMAVPVAGNVPGKASEVTKTGDGTDITVAGTIKVAAQLVVEIMKAGGRNVGQYRISIDGGDNFSGYRTIPVDGAAVVADTGVTVTFADGAFSKGTNYTCNLTAPVPTVASVIAALKTPLEIVDPEFIYVVGASDSVAWAALGALADDLWNRHRPTFFLCESRLPTASEDLNDWTTALKAECASFAHRFVSVCCGFGEIADRAGLRKTRNAAGLLAGRIISIPVQRDIGRVRDQSITGITVPDSYNETMQVELEEAGYVTLTRYAGLRGTYWGTARTMADTTSDYQRLEVVRTTFKAIRLMRLQALKALKDELGDPLQGADASGLAYLRTNLENALDTMVKAKPKELAGYVIVIPLDQDFVNNGVAVETKLVGIPIIDKINLFSSYTYAGSKFDPRLQG